MPKHEMTAAGATEASLRSTRGSWRPKMCQALSLLWKLKQRKSQCQTVAIWVSKLLVWVEDSRNSEKFLVWDIQMCIITLFWWYWWVFIFFCVHYFDTNPCWSCLTVRPEFRLSGPKSAAWRIEGWLPFSWKSQIPPMMKAGPRWSQTSKIQRHVTMFDCESNRFLFTTTNTHTYMCILYTDMCILYTVYICILTYYVVVSNTIDSETVASNILQGCRGSFGVSALAEIPRRPVLVLCQFAKMSAGIHPSIWM